MINFPIVLGELAPQTPCVITTDSNYTLFRPLDLGKVKYSSVSKVKKGIGRVEVRIGKSSIPLNLETNGFTCRPKHGSGKSDLYKFLVSTEDSNQSHLCGEPVSWVVNRYLAPQLWVLVSAVSTYCQFI